MNINKLTIENFKSVEKLDIAPTRVNVFIGEPNAGKSNIIEALSILSMRFPNIANEMVRFEEAADLFTDLEIAKRIKIATNLLSCVIEYEKNDQGALMNRFGVKFFQNELTKDSDYHYSLKTDGAMEILSPFKQSISTHIFTYIFKSLKNQTHPGFQPFLSPPFGENIPNLLMTNAALRKAVADVFKDFGLRIILRKNENKLFIVREEDDAFIDFKYQNISSTVQRVVFMLLAIKSNEGNVLVFDEPEANIYPFYSQTIANHIANDNRNQYFMTSHSAYLINKLIDETPPNELSIFLTEMKDFRTTVRKLTLEETERFAGMGEDAMLNLTNVVG